MDTDSLYLGLSCDSLEKAVYPAMAEKLRACKKEWFTWDKWSAREPGLFQAVIRGHSQNRTVQQVLFHGR